MSQLGQLALLFLRIGTFVFGGGFVFIKMLEPDVVGRYHWLTEQQFVDAVALGQMTPGPILVSATFVGYRVGGFPGAALATLCIFLPSFLLTLVAARYVGRLKQNRYVADILWGVRAAVVGIVVAAAVSIAQASCRPVSASPVGVIAPSLLALAALAALVWKKLDSGLVVVLCGLLGLAIWGK